MSELNRENFSSNSTANESTLAGTDPHNYFSNTIFQKYAAELIDQINHISGQMLRIVAFSLAMSLARLP